MIYFVRNPRTDLVKIGAARNVGERLRQLRSEYGFGLHVMAVMDGYIVEEKALHARFDDLRQKGEWFTPARDLLDFIARESRPWDDSDAHHRVGHNVRITEVALERARKAARDRGESVVAYISRIVAETALNDVEHAMVLRETETREWISEQKRKGAGE